MASRPYYDHGKQRWYMKWWAGPSAGWIKQPLGRHPDGDPPRKPKPGAKGRGPNIPPAIDLVARKYRDLETKARHGIDVAPARSHPLAEYIEAYRITFAATHAKDSETNLRCAARAFLEYCDAQGIKTVEAVTTKVCRDWMESLVGKLAHGSLKMYRGYLSPVWSRARVDRIVLENPWRDAAVPGRPKDRAPVYWTRDELDELIKACSPWLRDLVLIGVNLGLRISAMLSLTWDDVDFERNCVSVRQEHSKSGRRYQVPLGPTANEVLARRLVDNKKGSPLVFPGERSGALVKKIDSYAMLKKAAARAGIPDKGHHNHILRHTFASHRVMAGVPLLTVSAWLGHTSTRTTEIYAHLIPSESARHMDAFDLPPPTPPPPG